MASSKRITPDLSDKELAVLDYVLARATKSGVDPSKPLDFWEAATDAFDRIVDFNRQVDRQEQDLFERAIGMGASSEREEMTKKLADAIKSIQSEKNPTLSQLMEVRRIARS